jgi:hypothetical protein
VRHRCRSQSLRYCPTALTTTSLNTAALIVIDRRQTGRTDSGPRRAGQRPHAEGGPQGRGARLVPEPRGHRA